MLRVQSEGVALASHTVTFTPEEQSAREGLLAAAREAGLEGLDLARAAQLTGLDRRLVDRVARVLQGEDRLRRVGEALLVHSEALDSLAAQVRERWSAGSRLDVASIKELTGLSRKFVIPLLEYLDRRKVTRRSGNDRVVLANSDKA